MFLETLLIYSATIILITISTIYLYCKYKYNYSRDENVVYLEPEFPFGSVKSFATMQKSLGDAFKAIYDDLKKRTTLLGGFYTFAKPSIMLVDPELIKNVITKDFAHFYDRAMYVNEENDPLGAHLVALKGSRWKNSRAKITPTFTSGKMKMMFHTILATTEQLNSIINKHIEANESLDTREIFARLATDTIGSCAFGLDCNSLENPDVEFRKYGRKVFEFGLRETAINALVSTVPSIAKLLRIAQTPRDVTEFFMNVLTQTIEYREKNDVHRKDFLDLLIRLKNNQSVLDDQLETKAAAEGISFNELAAHAFVFFAAGFETSSSTLDFCLFELVRNPDVQEKAREEVSEVVKNYDGKLTYAGVMEMKYMEKVFSEVLRKYPPIPVLQRECTKDYEVPNSNIVIKKGTEVVVSTLGLQRDPEIYPNPDKFDPERFSDEEKAKRHPYTYLPFGEGPRICIGMRFALLQAKIVLAELLMHYKFELDAKTVTQVKFSPRSIFLRPTNQFWLKASHIK